jgi:hypothetical protein
MSVRDNHRNNLRAALNKAVEKGDSDNARDLAEQLALLNKEDIALQEKFGEDIEALNDAIEDRDEEWERREMDDDPVRDEREMLDDKMDMYRIAGIDG